MSKSKDPSRASLRFSNMELKREYETLAEGSPFSFTGLVELGLEIALPALRERIAGLKQPVHTEPGSKAQ